MRSETQFIPSHSINLSDMELFTPIVAAVGIFSFCMCVWGYYITPPVESQVIHQFITYPECKIVRMPSLSNFVALKEYAEALHFPKFNALLSYNLYAHPHATDIAGPERGHTLCDLTVDKTITSHVEYLQSQLIVGDSDPDCINA